MIRTICSFIVLLLFTRILGKSQLSQLTYFNYVTGITIGSIAANTVLEKHIPLHEGLISLAVWTGLAILVSLWSLKSTKARIILDGEPTIVIKKGHILEEAMKALRINMDDLSMLLRTKNVFSTKDVDYAILEPNGELSVLLKPPIQTVTKKDLNIASSPSLYMPSEIIVDGSIVEKNIIELGLSYEWLYSQLHQANVASIQEVFYAEVQSDGTLYIDRRNDYKAKQ
ncbi:YetF domain-containing protein [Psychrobacillus sp. L4]|uniref:YetF domain-containing protein n=1 Tax=Psychrobacillus sp. L4 TaxID=3236892 RepID=UPI0036F25DDC